MSELKRLTVVFTKSSNEMLTHPWFAQDDWSNSIGIGKTPKEAFDALLDSILDKQIPYREAESK